METNEAAALPPAVSGLIDDFSFLDDWEDRYRYVIELGKALEPLDDSDRTPANKVDGCVSQVWLRTDRQARDGEPVLHFTGDSDAHIVRGLIAILLTLFSDRTAREILATDATAVLQRLGLSDHLTPQRSNGLKSMIGRIRAEAEAALAG